MSSIEPRVNLSASEFDKQNIRLNVITELIRHRSYVPENLIVEIAEPIVNYIINGKK